MADQIELEELPQVVDPLIGASCTLAAGDLRVRMAEWRAVRDRATRVERIQGGVRLHLAADESVSGIADLVDRESQCCAFYTFSLNVHGGSRLLEATAAPGAEEAVLALIGA
jgi:hypothetical protein